MADFRSTSLADQVFDKLENDIIFGIYPRGEVLTELKLVEQLGVSRTPIREALRRLEQERLIADTGKGSIVLGITEEDLMDILAGNGFYSPCAGTVDVCNEGELSFYVSGAKDAWLEENAAETWGDAIVTKPVAVSAMHAWLKNQPDAFMAAIK